MISKVQTKLLRYYAFNLEARLKFVESYFTSHLNSMKVDYLFRSVHSLQWKYVVYSYAKWNGLYYCTRKGTQFKSMRHTDHPDYGYW